MQKINNKFEELFNKVDQAALELLNKAANNTKELESLKNENRELKAKLLTTLNQVEEYVQQLQQLKNDYINSYHKIK